jgi:uncharacterized BrkB/YihY/UPF0761 family membrane protein
MTATASEVRRRRQTVVNAAIVFVVILLIVQMWLLTATLESYLAGYPGVALPGALVSGALFLICFLLYRFAVRTEKAADRDPAS